MDAEKKLLMELTKEPMIAYFTMEIGINSNIPLIAADWGCWPGIRSNPGPTWNYPWWR